MRRNEGFSESEYNWFPGGGKVPIEPSWLPIPSAGCMYDGETREGGKKKRRKKKSPETWENTATQGGQRSNARQITSFWFCFCSFHLVWMHVFMRWAPLEGDNKGDAACRTGDPKAGGTMWPSWLPWYHEMPVKKICIKKNNKKHRSMC